MRRVSWASTRSVSSFRVWATASLMAFSVISLNTMRRTGTFGFSSSSKCQAMASPSRSPSVASRSSSDSLSRLLSSRIVDRFSGETT